MQVTDNRVLEACKGLGIDVNAASPQERFNAYCRWTGQVNLSEQGGLWSDVILDVLKGCGFRMVTEPRPVLPHENIGSMVVEERAE